MELGGLSVLRGSHREKVLDVTTAPGAGGNESILCGLDYAWVQDHYECGDILTFPSHMVHKALPESMARTAFAFRAIIASRASRRKSIRRL